MASPPTDVIAPPPGIREIISKTVGYVQRNGPAFIDRVRSKESQNAKFSFLFEDDVYYPYFAWYLKEGFRLDAATEAEASAAGPSAGHKDEKTSTTQTREKAQVPTGPTPFHFSPHIPPIYPRDLEIIKLTALFAARNGKAFVDQLAGVMDVAMYTSQFAFLSASHSLHTLYQSYVDQYRRTIQPTADMQEKLQRGLNSKYTVLTNARLRAEREADQQEKQRLAQEKEEKERLEYAQIDWDDFVVVETIEFSKQDYNQELAAPLTISQIQFAPLAEKQSGRFLEEAPPDFEPDNHFSRRPAKRARV